MQKNALYFPYIDVPRSRWLTETLVYWDKLSSIVPHEFHHNPKLLTSDMKNLTSAGLVENILPLEHFSKLHNFEENFTKIAKMWVSVNQNYSLAYSKIHVEKLGNLQYVLKDLNLTRGNHKYPWVEIPMPLANIFMSYLATELGKLPDLNATPITDLSSEIVNMHDSEKAIIRQKILTKILPIPNGDIEIDKLLRFKQDHGHLTKNFRSRIEKECIDILGVRQEDRDEKIFQTKQNLQDEIKEIENSMRSITNDIGFNNIMPLIGTLSSGIDSPGGVIGTGIAISSTINQVVSNLTQNRENRNKPLAYATITGNYF